MPEEDTNQNLSDDVSAGAGTGGAGDAGGVSDAGGAFASGDETKAEPYVKKKKRRRRRRKKKKKPAEGKQVPKEEGQISVEPTPAGPTPAEAVKAEGQPPSETGEKKPKKRRRRRKKKKKKPPAEEIAVEEELAPAEEEVAIPEEAVEEIPEEISEELPPEEEVAPMEEAPEEEIVEEIKPTEEEAEKEEEAFLATEGKGKEEKPPEPTEPTPVEAEIPPELPEEISGKAAEEAPAEEKPSTFHLEEKPEGPVGWDQLKEEIKKDYEEPEAEAPSEVPTEAPSAEEAPPTEEKPEEAITEKAAEEKAAEEAIVTPPVEEAKKEAVPKAPEEESERKEVVRIIAKYAISGCIVIAILLGIFIFQIPQRIYGLVRGFIVGEEQVAIPAEEGVEVVVPISEQTSSIETSLIAGKNKGTSLERFEEGVQTALVTGEEIPKIKRLSSAIEATFSIGYPERVPGDFDRITSYMDVLIRLQNSFSTDIHQLLDGSVNRSEALELHLIELKDIQNEAIQTFEKIKEEKDELKIEFNKATTEKELLEKDFFNAMENLRGNEANEILNDFIDASKRQIDLKAEFNALAKAEKMFDTAIKNMETRIKDIEYNKEALIKGVQVVDIKGSDLDLIIQEAQLE